MCLWRYRNYCSVNYRRRKQTYLRQVPERNDKNILCTPYSVQGGWLGWKRLLEKQGGPFLQGKFPEKPKKEGGRHVRKTLPRLWKADQRSIPLRDSSDND
jgi:hypothetical protein